MCLLQCTPQWTPPLRSSASPAALCGCCWALPAGWSITPPPASPWISAAPQPPRCPAPAGGDQLPAAQLCSPPLADCLSIPDNTTVNTNQYQSLNYEVKTWFVQWYSSKSFCTTHELKSWIYFSIFYLKFSLSLSISVVEDYIIINTSISLPVLAIIWANSWVLSGSAAGW